MDQAAVAPRRLEAMEVWTRSLRRAATPRRRPGPGSANCWRPTWPLAAREQPRTDHCSAKQLLCLARLGFRRGSAAGIIRRTAVYGPVRTVVWEGRSRETPPYPVCGEGGSRRAGSFGVHALAHRKRIELAVG